MKILIILVAIFTCKPIYATDYYPRLLFDVPDEFYTFPFKSSRTSDGRFYFLATTRNDDKRGLYVTNNNGNYQTIHYQEGNAAPELTGINTIAITFWVQNEDAFAYMTWLDGDGVDSSNEKAIYAGTAETGPKLIYRTGDEFPNLPGSRIAYTSNNMKINPVGNLVLSLQYYPDANDLSVLKTAILFYDGMNLSVVSTKGGNIVDIDNNSNILLVADLDGVAKIWHGNPNDLSSVIGVGDLAPALESQTILQINEVQFTETGIVYSVRLDNFDYAVYSKIGTTHRLVQSHHNALGRISADSYGRLSYLKYNNGNPTELIESEQVNNIPISIAELSQQIPDMENGVFFGNLETSTLSSNDFRQVLFAADIFGTNITGANDYGLWVYDPDHGLQDVLREGSTVEFHPGDVRTVVTANGTIDYRGKAVLQVSFQDGSLAFVSIKNNPNEILYYDGFD